MCPLDADDVRLLCDLLSSVLRTGSEHSSAVVRGLTSPEMTQARFTFFLELVCGTQQQQNLVYSPDQRAAVIEAATVFLKLVTALITYVVCSLIIIMHIAYLIALCR